MRLLPSLLLGVAFSEGIDYSTPKAGGNPYFWADFDTPDSIDNWKESENDKYVDGKWKIEALQNDALEGDMGLVLKEKAKHHALVSKMEREIKFDSDLIVQYEVAFQSGIECGGAYMKLLSSSNDPLESFHDKTPFTIMFGPDKCGADYKYHFIFRYKNPLTGEYTERSPTKKIDLGELQKKFTDNKAHLYTLSIKTDNSFSLMIDQKEYSAGNLLTDISPPIMPEKEIDDPEDFKPESWDERERIPDPAAVKPEDWDENAPAQIPDPKADKPADWLDDEEEMVPDPDSVQPDDWDEDMDGDWEAPLIPNPACEGASGCGTWEAPMIRNPDYKGKWKPETIANPDYNGKWFPKKIANPEYFEDLTPWKMTPVDRIGFELWTLSNDIYFDNILITDDISVAQDIAKKTFNLRKASSSDGIFGGLVAATEGRPWLWAVYVLAIVIPIFLLIACCCWGSSKTDDAALRKKTDEATPDDPHDSEEEHEGDKDSENEEENEDEEDSEVVNDVKDEVPELEGDSDKGQPQVEKGQGDSKITEPVVEKKD